VFIEAKLPGFKKAFVFHLPFGTQEAYVKKVQSLDLGGLASLVKICGFLMQKKIYLFWRR
jgi:hypothetical protein